MSVERDGMNAHRSAIDEPVSDRTNSLQVFNKVSLKLPQYHVCNSLIFAVILSRSNGKKRRGYGWNHGHARINAVTVIIHCLFLARAPLPDLLKIAV